MWQQVTDPTTIKPGDTVWGHGLRTAVSQGATKFEGTVRSVEPVTQGVLIGAYLLRFEHGIGFVDPVVITDGERTIVMKWTES